MNYYDDHSSFFQRVKPVYYHKDEFLNDIKERWNDDIWMKKRFIDFWNSFFKEYGTEYIVEFKDRDSDYYVRSVSSDLEDQIMELAKTFHDMDNIVHYEGLRISFENLETTEAFIAMWVLNS